jgi:trk system potassium uptake protein TrkH
VGKLVPKMRKTALILYVIYIVLTIANILFLLAGGMNLLDAACTAFGTAGTGGFGVRNDSFISLSPYLQNVTTVFMILFGINFSCYYLLLLGQIKGVFKDEELRLYLGIILAAIVLICLNVRDYYGTWEETIRHAAFQVGSIITTTGYTSFDYDLWPAFSKGILMILMFIGACAGSTGGGLKCSRLLLITKVLRRNISKLLHPNRVQAVRINDRVVDEQVLDNANAYLSAYMILMAASFMVISLDNFSLGTNFSAVVTCFNNVGPGFELVGPTCNYSAYSPLSKLVLCFDMMAGRLELFPMLALFSRRTWRQR